MVTNINSLIDSWEFKFDDILGVYCIFPYEEAFNQ